MAMKAATLEQLDLTGTDFPPGFSPMYCTKSVAEGFDGIWHVHDSEPAFNDGEWSSQGQVFEIGVDPTPDLEETPELGRGLPAQQAVFRIISHGQAEKYSVIDPLIA